MALIYLRHFDVAQNALAFDLNHGPQGERSRQAVGALSRGFYTVANGQIYGVFASSDGPVAFQGKQRWPLQQAQTSTELTTLANGHNRFVLRIAGQTAYEVTYAPDRNVVDNWSSDETLRDFFAWFHQSVIDAARFFPFYTQV